jgi:predicted alpha/beta superfamily hydrolase
VNILGIWLIVTSLLILSACGGSGSTSKVSTSSSLASSSSRPAHQYLGTIEATAAITSKITGITYPYHVYLPHKYAQSGEHYAIVYGTDGQWVFPYFSQVIDARNKPVIFVAIEEGPSGSDRRAIDYTPAGALIYSDFLKTEFIPMIESKYRANGERTYVGTSYGGLLGAILLSKEEVGVPYFKNYLLFDGAFWAYTANFIQDEEKRLAASKKLAINLVLTSANPGNYRDVNTYEKRYQDRQYEDINIYRKSFNVEHKDVGNPSFEYAIDLIY